MATRSEGATPPTEAEIAAKRLRRRNLAVAGVLAALFVIFYLITLHKGVPLIANRPM